MRKLVNLFILFLFLVSLLFVSIHSYHAGMSHAIQVASPYVDDDCIVIDFDGQEHVYDYE